MIFILRTDIQEVNWHDKDLVGYQKGRTKKAVSSLYSKGMRQQNGNKADAQACQTVPD